MQYLQVVLISAVSLVVLFLLTRLMGKKQIAQLNIFDYILGISIGSIAAEMSTEQTQLLSYVLAMAVYALAAVGISILTNRSVKLRAAVAGRPLLLMQNGEISRENLKKAKMDLSEFMMFCRLGGYFDLQQLKAVILEHNGAMSFLPKDEERPLTPKDMGKQGSQQNIPMPVILDGCLMKENLERMGQKESWLQQQLCKQGYQQATEILLALYDGSRLVCFPMQPQGDFTI